VQTGLTIAKIAAIGALLVLLFATGTTRMPAALGTVEPRAFLRALVAGLFAFGGWHMVTYAAEETRDAERTIPRALMLGTAVVVAVQAIWSSALVLTGTYRVIVSRVVYTEWIFFGALALGTISVRRTRGYLPAFRASGFPIVPVAFALVCLAIVVNQIATDPR